MAVEPSRQLGPGEARARQRRRRQIVYIVAAACVGGVIGFATGFFDKGDGNLFAGDWDRLALDPPVAILVAAMLLFGFAIMPLWGFTQIDEHKRQQNFIAFTGGCIAVIAGFPVWAALHAGGLVAAPDPFGIWLLSFTALSATYLYARLRM